VSGRPTLKRLVGRRGARDAFAAFAEELGVPFVLRDAGGVVRFARGETSGAEAWPTRPLEIEGEVLGELAAAPLEPAGERVIVLLRALAQMESERKAVAQEALHRYRELTFLYDFAEKLTAHHSVAAVAQVIVDETRTLIDGDSCSVRLYDRTSGDLTIVAAHGRENAHKIVVRPGIGIAGAVFDSGRAEVVNDVLADERFVRGGGRESSLLCAPLKTSEAVLGVLSISNESRREYSSEDLKLATTVALQGAIAIANVRYTEELQAHRDHLEELVSERTRELNNAMQELTRANQILDRLSMVDPLTGVANRRNLDELLDNEWQRATQERSPLSVVLIDVDCFKLFNDTYGHQAGDECLRKVAGALQSSLRRSSEVVARYGGEEFAVILPDTTADSAFALGEKLCAAVEALQIPHSKSGAGDVVTISGGVACRVPDPGEEAAALIAHADKALYAAKDGGRNRMSVVSVSSTPR
jgi:diguanylate cyclase (GGDEF)-like protein